MVDTSDVKIQFGDFVLVLDSYRTVKALQDQDHGGWASQMGKVIVYNLNTSNYTVTIKVYDQKRRLK